MIPATHDEIPPAIVGIRNDVYETARAERWPAKLIGPEVRRRITDLVDDMRLLRRDELAEFDQPQAVERSLCHSQLLHDLLLPACAVGGAGI